MRLRPDRPPHPLSASTLRHWIRLLAEYRGRGPLRWPLALGVTVTLLLSLPVQATARRAGRNRSRGAGLRFPPLFILGHWRSGTSHLHKLLSLDPALGYVSLAKCAVPGSPLLRAAVVPVLRRFFPRTRVVDQMLLGMREPQEEEWLMASRSPIAFNHAFYFPLALERILGKLLNPSRDEAAEWSRLYEDLVFELTLENQGRRLVLKSPANLARIPLLLRLFPEARFIHVFRNPYEVYESTLHLWKTLLSWWSFQPVGLERLRGRILDLYPMVMERFFQDSSLIPPGHLAQVRFEDLDRDPSSVLRDVYARLGLGPFSRLRPELDRYLRAHSGYQRNAYSFSREKLRRIYRHWHLTIDRWGYSSPPLGP